MLVKIFRKYIMYIKIFYPAVFENGLLLTVKIIDSSIIILIGSVSTSSEFNGNIEKENSCKL